MHATRDMRHATRDMQPATCSVRVLTSTKGLPTLARMAVRLVSVNCAKPTDLSPAVGPGRPDLRAEKAAMREIDPQRWCCAVASLYTSAPWHSEQSSSTL